jgi:hypothetical protein
VIDCFISGEANAEGAFPRQELLQFGHLRENDPHYKIYFVPAKKQPGKYAALRVVPIPTPSKIKTPSKTKPRLNKKSPQQKK